jgi:hypothetical protein
LKISKNKKRNNLELAREGRSVQLDENLFAEFVATMRLHVSFTAEKAVAVLPVMDSVRVANSMKDIVKPSILN